MIRINILVKGEKDFVREYLLPDRKAEQILASPKNIVMIDDENGNWTGETINKSFIICTEKIKDPDSYSYSLSYSLLPPPSEETKEQNFKKMRDVIDKIGKELKSKLGWKNLKVI